MTNVKRIVLEGNWQSITFPKATRVYFVKNFSDAPIYVSFEENDSENTSIKILSGTGEQVASNMSPISQPEDRTNTIYVKGTGEIEVQQM